MSRASRDKRTGRHGRKLPGSYMVAVVAIGVVALPWLAHGLVGALGSNSNDPRQWLPRGFDETETYHWLQAHFGRDEITVVSWPGCTLDDPRTEQLARALLRDPQAAYFQRALTGQQTLQQQRSESTIYYSRSFGPWYSTEASCLALRPRKVCGTLQSCFENSRSHSNLETG